jgi:hypothetical protein
VRTSAIVVVLIGTAYGQVPKDAGGAIEDSEVSIQFRVMPEAVFNLVQMTEVARTFLGTTAASHRVAVLIAYDSAAVAAHEAANCEGSYRHWKLLYDHFPQVPLAAAQVITLGPDAALRLRTSKGDIQHMVLRGVDPTEFSFEGNRFEILHATGRVRSIFEGCLPGTVEPVLYLRTTARLDENLCKRATSWLAARLGTEHAQTEFANSRWFPCDARFPLVYPFGPVEPQPSENEYYALQVASCFLRCGGKPTCLSATIPRPSKARGER